MLSSIWLFLSIHMVNLHEVYMQRCIELALLGSSFVAPNPMVGSVLVHEGRIIGEGWHKQYGGPHAEVNCINSVSATDQELIPFSTLYVSLEPCAHYGKTPPCTSLIIEKKIKRVVIGCRDPFDAVNGKGIALLKQSGVEVIEPVLEEEAKALNRRFFCFHRLKRPYIILKWAHTADGFIAADNDERLLITDEATNRLVHQWRAEEASILVGTATVRKDNPSLTNRLWYGKHPLRMMIDRQLKLPTTLHIFHDGHPLIVFNEIKEGKENAVQYVKFDRQPSLIPQILNYCYQHQIQSVLVEGGAALLSSFLDSGCWDEIRTLTNQKLYIEKGLKAPALPSVVPVKKISMGNYEINFYDQHQMVKL